jgi:hypothetical protein
MGGAQRYPSSVPTFLMGMAQGHLVAKNGSTHPSALPHQQQKTTPNLPKLVTKCGFTSLSSPFLTKWTGIANTYNPSPPNDIVNCITKSSRACHMPKNHMRDWHA